MDDTLTEARHTAALDEWPDEGDYDYDYDCGDDDPDHADLADFGRLSLGDDGERSAARRRVADWLRGRTLYHAAPLHYLPCIAQEGALYSADQAQSLGVVPRRSAQGRDRAAGLHAYVHLAFSRDTPMLRQKLARGLPHVVLALDAAAVYARDPGGCALQPCNAKAWRSRSALTPMRDAVVMASMLRAHARHRHYPNLEWLVADCLPLSGALREVTAFCPRDHELAGALLEAITPPWRGLLVERAACGYECGLAVAGTRRYVESCVAASRALLPPPRIAFD